MQRLELLTMSRFVTKFLTCSIIAILALPPGWCCMLPISTASFQNDAAPTTDCDCCCDTSQPTDSPQSAPKAPRDPAKCCCGYRDLAKPSSFDYFLGDYVVWDAVSVAPELATQLRPLITSNLAYPVASQPIHVLDCVWLC